MLQEYLEERNEFLGAMSCEYMYDVRQCDQDPEEENYKKYADCNTTRLAIHVGDQPFDDGDAIFYGFRDDLFGSQKAELEFLLDHYKVSDFI